jgi:hypothetical protein
MKYIFIFLFIVLSNLIYSQTTTVFIPTTISNRSPSALQYTKALKYCADLVESGYSDWRLPKLDELQEYIFSGGNIPSNGIITWIRGDFNPLDPLYGTVAGFIFSIDVNSNGQIYSTIESQGSNGLSSGPIGTNFCHCVR